MGKGELDVLAEELLEVGTLGLGSLDLLNLKDLDAGRRDSVLTSHLLEELVDGTDSGGVTELLPDVVGGSAGLVAERDTEVLDGQGLLLVDLGPKSGGPLRKIIGAWGKEKG